MRKLPLNHSIRHMFLTLGGFVAAILLLESAGLENWANRLEAGPLRTIAQPTASALNWVLQPFGIAGKRDRVLDEAARMGWSDDAVRLARVTPLPPEQGSEVQPNTSHRSSAQASAELPPESKSVLSAAAVAPIVGSVPHSANLTPLAPIEQGRPRVVALAGDSMMAVGFGAGLMRKASEDRNLRLLRAFKSGTGLARPDVFNWIDQYPAMLGSEKPDVVIVAIGANDGQSFVVDGKVVLFGSEEWRKMYQSRVAEFLAMVESTGAQVLWVGLPPMRSEPFNQRISMVNRIAYTVVSQDPKASWWSTTSFVGDNSGSFREFADLPNGRQVRLRAPDGIHFTEEGASTMTAVLLKWLDPSSKTAEGVRAWPPAKPAAPLIKTQHLPQPATFAAAHPEPTRR
jgi:uncharacterized protein